MNLKQLQDMLVAVRNTRRTFAIVSGPGIGKTQVIYQTADRLKQVTGKNWWCYSLVASQYDSFDLVGFNVPQRKADNSLGAMLTEPFWWEGIAAADGVNNFCILLIDEYADCGFETQKIIAQIVNDRRVGNRKLPEGVWVLLAGNRRKDKSGVQRTASMFQNRINEVHVDYDVELHLQRMITTNMHPAGLAFIRLKGAAMFKDEVPAEPGPFYTPRSFEKCVATLAEYGQALGTPASKLPADTIAEEIMSGDLGPATAGEFKRHLAYGDEIPELDEIMLDPDNCRLADSLAGQFITSFMISQRISTDKQLGAAVTYLNRMKVELQVVAFKTLIDRDTQKGELKGLFAHRAFSDWAARHRDVLMMSA